MVASPSLPGMWRTSRTVSTCLSVLNMNWRVRMTRPSGLRSLTTRASPSQVAAAFIVPRGVKTSVGWPPIFSTREICMPSVRSNSSPSWKISRRPNSRPACRPSAAWRSFSGLSEPSKPSPGILPPSGSGLRPPRPPMAPPRPPPMPRPPPGPPGPPGLSLILDGSSLALGSMRQVPDRFGRSFGAGVATPAVGAPPLVAPLPAGPPPVTAGTAGTAGPDEVAGSVGLAGPVGLAGVVGLAGAGRFAAVPSWASAAAETSRARPRGRAARRSREEVDIGTSGTRGRRRAAHRFGVRSAGSLPTPAARGGSRRSRDMMPAQRRTGKLPAFG